MGTLNRILTWIVIVISIVGILVCLAGVVGSWVLNERITNGILSLISGVDGQLSSIEDLLIRSNDRIQSTVATLQSIRETASQLGNNIEENTPLLDTISQLLEEEIGPGLDTLRESFQLAREAILSINDALEALNALPRIELPTLTDELEALETRIQELSQAAQQLQASFSDMKAGFTERLVDPFVARIDRISDGLSALSQSVGSYLSRIDNLQVALETSRAQIPATIDTISIILTLVLVWAGLGQISIILAGILYLKTGRMVWEFNPTKHPVESTVLETGS